MNFVDKFLCVFLSFFTLIGYQTNKADELIKKLILADGKEEWHNVVDELIIYWNDNTALEVMKRTAVKEMKDLQSESFGRLHYLFDRIEFRRFLGQEILMKIGYNEETSIYNKLNNFTEDYLAEWLRNPESSRLTGNLDIDSKIMARACINLFINDCLGPNGIYRFESVFSRYIEEFKYRDDKNIHPRLPTGNEVPPGLQIHQRRIYHNNEHSKDLLVNIVRYAADTEMRRTALDLLADSEAAEKIDEISTFLTDSDKFVVGHTAVLLAKLGAVKYKKDIAAILNGKNIVSRSMAARALAILGDKDHVEEITLLLKDPELKHSSGDKINVLFAIGEIGNENLGDEVAEFLEKEIATKKNHFDDGVIPQAIKTLVKLKSAGHAEIVAKILKNSELSSEKKEAIKYLTEFKAIKYSDLIAESLDDKDPFVRAAAVGYFAACADEKHSDKIAGFIANGELEELRMAAIRYLISIHGTNYCDLLINSLKKRQGIERNLVIEAILSLWTDECAKEIVGLAQGENHSLRILAIKMLVEKKEKWLVRNIPKFLSIDTSVLPDDLIKWRYDDFIKWRNNKEVKEEIIRAIGSLRLTEYRDILKTVIKNENEYPHIREIAWQALIQMDKK